MRDDFKTPYHDRPFRDWFREPGAYVLVDGQFGSTGKGLLAGYIAEQVGHRINKVTTNAGPNSGHTAYYPLPFGIMNDQLPAHEKIVTKQVPVSSVFLEKMGYTHDVIINAGAIIDPFILLDEMGQWFNRPLGSRVLIHPSAALINDAAKQSDKVTENKIASTGKGVGPALVQKVMRTYGKKVLAQQVFPPFLPPEYRSWDDLWDWNKDRVFVETAQGFSLGINSSRFYPCVTSRECTVGQALSDARIPAQMLRKVVCTFRTYPIRVGNMESSSGDWYPDQEETTWEALGVTPELTTVTKRVRRVASWSWIQYRECLATNRPDTIFVNFMNYLKDDHQSFIERLGHEYYDVMGRMPDFGLFGSGPLSSDIQGYRWMPR